MTALATKHGTSDGRVDAILRLDDMRGRFNNRHDLAESDWPAYRDAYLDECERTRKVMT